MTAACAPMRRATAPASRDGHVSCVETSGEALEIISGVLSLSSLNPAWAALPDLIGRPLNHRCIPASHPLQSPRSKSLPAVAFRHWHSGMSTSSLASCFKLPVDLQETLGIGTPELAHLDVTSKVSKNWFQKTESPSLIIATVSNHATFPIIRHQALEQSSVKLKRKHRWEAARQPWQGLSTPTRPIREHGEAS